MCWWGLSLALTILFPLFCECSKCEKNSDCINGVCKANICICNHYWWGDLCQFCRERRSEGDKSKMKIVEGEQNLLPSKCAWLIETNKDILPKNRSIRLTINEFSGTCGNQSLYIYDGSSVQSPLIAVISKLITTGMTKVTKPPLHLKAVSGFAFIVLVGNNKPQDSAGCQFDITYSFEQQCSERCSSHGFCEEHGQCKCERGWTTSNCTQPTCPVPCINGSCDQKTRRCICLSGFRGESCNISERLESWSVPVVHSQDRLDGVGSHAMAVYASDIWLFGGLSLAKGPLNTLARYSIIENSWELIQASISSTVNRGKRPCARYGHTLVTYKNSLFLFGGTNQSGIFNDLWSFNVMSRRWMKHNSTKPLGVLGHSATIVGTTMIVLFGYSFKEGFSKKIQVFDLVDHKWNIDEAPSYVRPTYGHSSVYDPTSQRIYVHGGYRLLPDKSCTEASSDLMAYDVRLKEWNTEPFRSSGIPRFLHTAVLFENRSMLVFGGRGQTRSVSPSLAVYDLADKQWRAMNVANVSVSLLRYGHSSVLVNSTMHVFGGFGGKMFNSFLQYSFGDCWLPTSSVACRQALSPIKKMSHGSCVSNISSQGSCWHQKTCALCLEAQSECLWCESHKQCIPKIAFNIVFSYQQCLQVLEGGRDTCASANCSNMKSCQECHTLPGCGWCDDISATGLGRCMEGGNNGSFRQPCVRSQWHFVECPACQCHGHSKCSKGNICGECKDHTTGSNCDQCAAGYFGDPRNGGKCRDCQCTAHAESCTMDTGVCNCLTLGVSGRRCDACDNSDGYYGNISKNNFCYFAFRSKRVFSFNLTGKRLLGFAYYPSKEKRNVKLEVMWTKNVAASAYLNVTSFYAYQPNKQEDRVDEKRYLGSYQGIYRYQDFDFDNPDKFGLRGYVYDVSCEKTCLLKVIITQPTDNIDLLEFFLTFFGCFLSLLIVAGIVWKVRNHYISFLLSRQRREERHKMASRPFSRVSFLVHSPIKATPGLVSVEPCANSKASVLTVLIRLPGDKWGVTPTGQSGVCFASVLASHGEAPGNNTARKPTRMRTRKKCSATSV